VDPLLQSVEVEAVAVGLGDDDLAVDDAPVGQGFEQRPQELR
jgi:hypothetical protein